MCKEYLSIYRFEELDYLVEDIYCYSEFHALCGAIIRQLPKITGTKYDAQNWKIQNNAYWRDVQKCDWLSQASTFFNRNFLECLQLDISSLLSFSVDISAGIYLVFTKSVDSNFRAF